MQSLLVRKPFTLGGQRLSPGDIVDLAKFDLPRGRAAQLVDQRYGEQVTVEPETTCGECGREFNSPQGVKVHAARAHRPKE